MWRHKWFQGPIATLINSPKHEYWSLCLIKWKRGCPITKSLRSVIPMLMAVLNLCKIFRNEQPDNFLIKQIFISWFWGIFYKSLKGGSTIINCARHRHTIANVSPYATGAPRRRFADGWRMRYSNYIEFTNSIAATWQDSTLDIRYSKGVKEIERELSNVKRTAWAEFG